MKYLLIPLLFITFWSCKKEEKSQEHWQQKTTETYNKLVSLSDKYTCTDMPNISIKSIKDYLCTSYVLVHKSDNAKFDNLLNEYDYYIKKLSESGYYSTIYILCANLYPVKIDCVDRKPKIAYLQDLNSEEFEVEMAKLYDEIKKYYDNTPCNNPNDWLGIPLLTEGSVEAIVIKKGDTNYNYKVNTYNQMIIKQLRSEGKKIEFDSTTKITVRCENNKAQAEFE